LLEKKWAIKKSTNNITSGKADIASKTKKSSTENTD